VAKKRVGVLEDHKRVGNRLKSPWLTEFNFQFVSHVDEVLPEIVLLGLLNDAHGYARGAQLSLALARALTAIDEPPDPLLSVFGGCSAAKIKQVSVFHSVAIFSFTKSEAGLARTALSRILEATGDQQKYELSKLIIERMENFALNPAHVAGWSTRKLDTIKAAFIATMFTNGIRDDADLMLF
jgi:hypothetical protein